MIAWFIHHYSKLCWALLVIGLSFLWIAIFGEVAGSNPINFFYWYVSGIWNGCALSLMLFVRHERNVIRDEERQKSQRIKERLKNGLEDL